MNSEVIGDERPTARRFRGMGPGRGVVLLAGMTIAGACAHPAPPPAPVAPRHVAEAVAYRPADGLLERADLQAVVELQEARNGRALAARLEDPDPAVRARAAFALGSVQDTSVAPALERALEDEDARVRADAAFALGQTGRGATALLDRFRIERDTTVLTELLGALGRAGDAATLDSLLALELPEPRGPGADAVRAALALSFARFGLRGLHDPVAVDWLTDALRADEPAVRQNAAYYFGRVRDPEPWSRNRRRLLHVLEDYSRGDRAAGQLLLGLSRLEDDDDVSTFAAWLAEATDWTIRVNAAVALGRRHSSDARVALLAALDDASPHVRRAAAAALAAGDTLDYDAAAPLQSLLSAPDIRADLAQPLLVAEARAGRGRWVLRWYETQSDPALRRAAMDALARVPERAAWDALVAATADPDLAVAGAAVEALGARWADRPAVDPPAPRWFGVFADALRRRDVALAYAAADALADSSFMALGSGTLLESVYLQMTAPQDQEAMVRILEALGELREPSAVPMLRQALASEYPPLRAAAVEALAKVTGNPARPDRRGPGPAPALDWGWLAQWGSRPRITLETGHGAIVIELAVEQAPLTSQTILGLTVAGAYDGVPFHRVVPNFVIQGGDFARGDGWGGPGYAIRSELTRIPYLRGTVGMASAGRDTEGSQYFITHSMQPHLDGNYTAFATVVDGLDVVDAVREGDVVVRATVQAWPGE